MIREALGKNQVVFRTTRKPLKLNQNPKADAKAMDNIKEVKKKFIGQIALIGKHWGLGEPAGRVWGLMLFEENPLSQREISKECNYSLSLVSPSLTILKNWGLIGVVEKRGREKLYAVTTSFLDAFEKLLKNFMEMNIEPIIATLSSAKGNKTKKKIQILTGEYKKMLLFSQFFSAVINAKKTLSPQQVKKLLNKSELRIFQKLPDKLPSI